MVLGYRSDPSIEESKLGLIVAEFVFCCDVEGDGVPAIGDGVDDFGTDGPVAMSRWIESTGRDRLAALKDAIT